MCNAAFNRNAAHFKIVPTLQFTRAGVRTKRHRRVYVRSKEQHSTVLFRQFAFTVNPRNH